MLVCRPLKHHPNFGFAVINTSKVQQALSFLGILNLDPLSTDGNIILELLTS
jgi:hypothetical protein